MAKQNYVDGWLYADNQRFINGELDMPVNQAEIIENLKLKHMVFDVSRFNAIPASIGLILFGLCWVGFLPYIFIEILEDLGTLKIAELFFDLGLGFCLMYMTIGLVVMGWRMLFPQNRKVEAEWQQLLSTRIICSGRIIDDEARGMGTHDYQYEFQNPLNKIVKGRYHCKWAFVVDFKKQELRGEAGVPGLRHPDPKEVKVWYVNDKIHTLL